MKTSDKEKVRQAVRESYGKIAKSVTVNSGIGPTPSCCDPSQNATSTSVSASCCGGNEVTTEQLSGLMGDSKEDILSIPEGANMGLGCGNPVALASLKPGETVVDLGSGGGFDCFLAAKQVGESGQIIGVDMTPDMITKARMNAEKIGSQNVEFRLGEIEHLPVADNSADIIMSNCVINLSPDKAGVFRDAFRILKTDLLLRPVFHQKENRSDAHIFITLLAYHLLHSIRSCLKQKGIHLSWQHIRDRMSTHCRLTNRLKTKDGHTLFIRKCSEAEDFHKTIYNALHLDHSPCKLKKYMIKICSDP